MQAALHDTLKAPGNAAQVHCKVCDTLRSIRCKVCNTLCSLPCECACARACVRACVCASTKLYLRSDTLLNMLPGKQPVYTKELNLSLHKPKLDCISSSFATGSWAIGRCASGCDCTGCLSGLSHHPAGSKAREA